MVWACLLVFGSSFVIALTGALMPGPLLTVTISEAGRQGPRAGPLLMAGHALLELGLLAALFLGLKEILEIPAVLRGISLAGAAVLLWMGLGILRSLPALQLEAEPGAPAQRRLVATGALMSLANPYWTIWWATIGLAYISRASRWGLAGIGAFFCGHILADIAWYCFVALAVSRGRQILSRRSYQLLLGSCAVLLLLFAGYFGHAGLSGTGLMLSPR